MQDSLLTSITVAFRLQNQLLFFLFLLSYHVFPVAVTLALSPQLIL